MRQILTGNLIVLFLMWSAALLSQTGFEYERFKKLSERNFDEQNFDSCLYYSYISAHYYAKGNDTAGLVNTWFNIAIVNLLQEKYEKAQAAYTIACSYIPNKTVTYNDLKSVYYNVLKFKNLSDHKPLSSGTLNLTGLSPTLLRKLYYMTQLSKTECDYKNNRYDLVKAPLLKLIFNMNRHCDTAWFGYAKANMLMGHCFYYKFDYLHSISYYETAIRIYEGNCVYNTDWIEAYSYLIDALGFTGQSEKRDSCFQRLEKYNLINKNRVNYYFIKGDFTRFRSKKEALDAYLQAYCSADNISTETMYELKKQIIYCFVSTGQYDKALEWYKKLKTTNIPDYLIIMVAYSYIKLGYIDNGNALIKQVGIKKLQDISIYWLAKYYFETKKYDKAEIYYKKYLQFLITTYGNIRYMNSFAYSALGYLYWFGRADYRRSLEYYHKAVFELTNDQAPKNLYQMPDINKSISDIDLSREFNNKAETLFEVSKLRKTKTEKLRDLKASLANLEVSFTVAHRYKMSLNRDDQRFEFADNIKHWFPYIINVCMELYRETGKPAYAGKAFEYAEKSKASLLLSTIRGINAYHLRLLPDSLKKAEEQTWTKTELISRYLVETYNSLVINQVKIDQYNTSLNRLKHQQDSLIRIFKQKYPAYYNARYNAEVVSAGSLQKMLAPNEAVLEYSVSADKLVIFLLTRKDFKIFTDTLGGQFFTDVETYRKVLSNFTFDFRDSVIRAFAGTANRLYNRLVKPAAPYTRGTKLLIIPDDALTQVPFETLVTAPLSVADTATYRRLPYLIKNNAICYSYSGTLYAMNCQPSACSNAKLLAVAPGYEKGKLNKLFPFHTMDITADTSELTPIPGTFDEVKDIHRIFGGKLLMKKQATEKHFKEIEGRYDILHLAAHGSINNEYPMFSKLLFTPGTDSVNDGLLNTYEIYNMQVNARLVVLSACNTGYGKLHKGEGIISMSRGFFTAGAKSIIMTLWPADDKTSSTLIKNFYANLAANQNIGDALYHAKLKYLEQTDDLEAHPYYWAGYIAIGNTSATFEPGKPKTKYYLLTGIGILMVIVIILKKRQWRNFLLRQN